MSYDEPEPVRQRRLAAEYARYDCDRAADVARAIADPWYRCQALAYVAEDHPDTATALALLDAAFAAAYEHDEPNRLVTVASWPLRALAKVAPARARGPLAAVLAVAAREPHNLRRADALVWVAAAVTQVPALKAKAVPPLIEALLGGHGWRIERVMARTAMLIQADYPLYVEQLLAAHPENRRRRRLLERLAAEGGGSGQD